MLCLANLRIEIVPPLSTIGDSTILTRLPSASRASTSGLELVDAAADRRGDALRDIDDMLDVAEPRVGPFELAAPLDIDARTGR